MWKFVLPPPPFPEEPWILRRVWKWTEINNVGHIILKQVDKKLQNAAVIPCMPILSKLIFAFLASSLQTSFSFLVISSWTMSIMLTEQRSIGILYTYPQQKSLQNVSSICWLCSINAYPSCCQPCEHWHVSGIWKNGFFLKKNTSFFLFLLQNFERS